MPNAPPFVLQWFDAKKLLVDRQDPVRLGFTGKTGAGKTQAALECAYLFRHRVTDGLVFSPSEATKPKWSHVFPRSFVHTKYDPVICAKHVIRARKQERMVEVNPHYKLKESLTIFDDCAAEYGDIMNKDKSIRTILMNGRNMGMNAFFIIQYMMNLKRDLRSMIDYLFVFYENDKGNRKRLHENWFPFLERREFDALMDYYCKDHFGLVLSVNEASDDPRKRIFLWKAPESLDPTTRNVGRNQRRRDWKVGGRSFWTWHYLNFVPPQLRHVDEQEDERKMLESLLSNQRDAYKKALRGG